MEPIGDILNKRSTPGILIIDPENKVLHSNREALAIIPSIQTFMSDAGELTLPDELESLCDRLKENQRSVSSLVRAGRGAGGAADAPYALRAFYIDARGGESGNRAIIVLMERVVAKHEVDFGTAKQQYGLSRRELQVLQLLCKGLSNREIGETMFICEYTVKDHIKKIMKRMKVKSRSEMIAALT